MKKIIDYLKHLIRKFTSRKGSERYILNNKYRKDAELIKFIQERIKTLDKSSTPFVLIWDDFPTDQYGKVELVLDNKVVQTAKLMRDKNNLIYKKFDECENKEWYAIVLYSDDYKTEIGTCFFNGCVEDAHNKGEELLSKHPNACCYSVFETDFCLNVLKYEKRTKI